MPFQSSDIVLVTGGNGHVGQHLLSQLLSLPVTPTVRTTVRSQRAASQVQNFFEDEVTRGKLDIVLVPDITAANAFDKVLDGVTHIAHVASPLIVGAVDVEKDLLIPAIHGTISLLRSALKFKSIKSVVLTGSFASVVDVSKGWRPGYTYTPSDWNPITYETASDPKLDLTQWDQTWRLYITYMASKKLAEKAAWELWNEQKPSWDFNMVLPNYIVGPYLLPISMPDGMSYSNQLVWTASSGQELPALDYPYWVDVRDVARAHIAVLERPEITGQRFILSSRGLTYSDV